MTRQQQLQEDTHFRVLSLLESQPDLNQREMAKALGVSLGGVNYCLRALAAKGLVKMSSFQASENKLAYAYLLTPQGMTEKVALTGRFLKRKQEEYAALKAEIEALQKAVAIVASGLSEAILSLVRYDELVSAGHRTRERFGGR